MIGAVAVAVVVVVLLPVALMMSGAVVSAVLGWALRDDAEKRYQGSELVDLSR